MLEDSENWNRKMPRDWEDHHLSFDPDIWQAFTEVCYRERWTRSRVVDSLLQGFLTDYRQMWPEEGMMQTQLALFEGEVESMAVPTESQKEDKVARGISLLLVDCKKAIHNNRPNKKLLQALQGRLQYDIDEEQKERIEEMLEKWNEAFGGENQ